MGASKRNRSGDSQSIEVETKRKKKCDAIETSTEEIPKQESNGNVKLEERTFNEHGHDGTSGANLEGNAVGAKYEPEGAATNEKNAKKKRVRTRVRKIHGDLRNQMEFYFSDANLRKDRYMKEMVTNYEDGWIPVTEFLKFNKIKTILERKNLEAIEIAKAVKNSKLLEVGADCFSIRRNLETNPVKDKNSADIDGCTVYVEGLPNLADVPWLRKTFAGFGPVEYVSIPRKPTGQHKGFGFIEFEQESGAENACKFYNLKTGRMACSQPAGSDVERRGVTHKLHVIPKLEWIRLKEHYAELRKKNASVAKQYLKMFSTQAEAPGNPEAAEGRNEDQNQDGETAKRGDAKEETVAQNEVKSETAPVEEMTSGSKSDDVETVEAAETDEFPRDCIVKISVKEKLQNSNKATFRSIGNVVYVDLIEGDTATFIRFDKSENAAEYLQRPEIKLEGLTMIDRVLLKDEEERAYWQRVQLMRGKKRNRTKDKQRGKQRLQGRYEKHVAKTEETVKINKHIVFGD